MFEFPVRAGFVETVHEFGLGGFVEVEPLVFEGGFDHFELLAFRGGLLEFFEGGVVGAEFFLEGGFGFIGFGFEGGGGGGFFFRGAGGHGEGGVHLGEGAVGDEFHDGVGGGFVEAEGVEEIAVFVFELGAGLGFEGVASGGVFHHFGHDAARGSVGGLVLGFVRGGVGRGVWWDEIAETARAFGVDFGAGGEGDLEAGGFFEGADGFVERGDFEVLLEVPGVFPEGPAGETGDEDEGESGGGFHAGNVGGKAVGESGKAAGRLVSGIWRGSGRGVRRRRLR